MCIRWWPGDSSRLSAVLPPLPVIQDFRGVNRADPLRDPCGGLDEQGRVLVELRRVQVDRSPHQGDRARGAALSLGANRLVTFFRVVLPLSWPGIFSGALFAFITSFDEVVVAIFLSGAKPTLPKQMWDGIRVAINPTISAVASLLIVFSVVLLLILQVFSRRTGR